MLFHRIPSVARTAAVPGQRKHSRSAICLHHFACTCAARESGACVRARCQRTIASAAACRCAAGS
ncbi:hypothetical protein JKF63_04225 [Porcisia hertigi]|uniref:Uncharacterized protein n=1 Tax=Porcisia hertigi TaxID=2761500 RepID=A0A836IS41_9TRYP|nr:hypothetical protein JKF63_04225 [Porcisia hertigi]